MATHNEFGKEAEDLAARYLERQDYEILARNYRHGKAEIDLICRFEHEIIFVEVKARGTTTLIDPIEAVNRNKIRLYLQAADFFLQGEKPGYHARFDILSIRRTPTGDEIEHFPDAFDATTLLL